MTIRSRQHASLCRAGRSQSKATAAGAIAFAAVCGHAGDARAQAANARYPAAAPIEQYRSKGAAGRAHCRTCCRKVAT